jgi:YVTN family beta-propeller protein
MTPRQVGNYRLDSLLGVGGMGEVYQAYDSHRDRYVALKLLPEFFSGDREYLKRFQRESLVAARLREPHVIPIHDFGEVDGRLFIDMRLVDGIDMRMMLDENGPIAPQRTVNLLSQVAQALDAAHADGLVHRDIKPSNILVTSSDFVYVVDFGIARPVGGRQTSLTITGATIGTLAYMAPERFAGHAVDARADIYSLACVLYECLTATPPFQGDDLPSLMYAHLDSSPPQASSLVAGVPPALDAVVARGMSKNPADRYSTASALAAAAQEALLLGAPSPASRPQAPASRPQATVADGHDAIKRSDREPRAASVSPTVSAAFVPTYVPTESANVNAAKDPGSALLAGNASTPPRSATPRRPAREPRWRRSGMLVVTGAVAIGIVIALITNFSGRKPGNSANIGNRGNAAAVSSVAISQSARASVAASPVVDVPVSAADPRVMGTVEVGETPNDIQIAPDGKFAYIANPGADAIQVLDTATDQLTGTIPITQGPPQFVSFSPDSQTAYVSVYNNSETVHLIAFVDTATGKVTSTVPVNNDSPGPSAVSPDGRYLYVPNHNMSMTDPNGRILDEIDTTQKRLVHTLPLATNPHWVVFSASGQYVYISDHMSSIVTVLNSSNNKVVNRISVGETPHGEAISPGGSILAVTSYYGNFVSFIDTATDKVVKRVNVEANPQACAYAPDGRHLYVVNNVSGTVTVIDTADYATRTVRVGNAPTSIAVLPNGRQAYVSNDHGGTITVLNIAQ